VVEADAAHEHTDRAYVDPHSQHEPEPAEARFQRYPGIEPGRSDRLKHPK